MSISLFCPVCSVKVEVPDRLAGKSAPCPSCGNVVDIPKGDRPAGASRLVRRLKSVASLAVAALALLAAALAWIQVSGSRDAISGLQEEVEALQEKVAGLEAARAVPARPADARAVPRPDATPPAVTAADHAALRRELEGLRESHEGLQQRVHELEADLTGPKKPAPTPEVPVPVLPELASDEDIALDFKGQLDAMAPRPRFVFVGNVANAGSRSAPVVQITIRVTGFQGLDPINRQIVTAVSYAASMTERVRSLPPGTRAQVIKDLFPNDPALLTRDVVWEPQFEASAKVLRE